MHTLDRIARIRTLALPALLMAGAGLGGCVNQSEYDKQRDAISALTAENQALREEKARAERAIEELRSRANRGELTQDEAQRLIAQLQAELEARDRALRDLDSRLAGIGVGPLDAATDSALAELAERFPNVLSYDPARGLLRFTSDVTFASGSYELTAQGQQTVGELARILRQTPSAQQYDVRVVGHTDAQRVRAVAGRPFKNNLELSAFRAISVHGALVSGGLSPNKVEIAGWGESRPAVANSGTGNTPANRRVEVYLVRSTLDSAPAPAPLPERRQAPTPPNPDVFK